MGSWVEVRGSPLLGYQVMKWSNALFVYIFPSLTIGLNKIAFPTYEITLFRLTVIYHCRMRFLFCNNFFLSY